MKMLEPIDKLEFLFERQRFIIPSGAKVSESSEPEINWTKKPVLLIYHNKDGRLIDGEEKMMINRMLEAVKLSENNCTIVPLNKVSFRSFNDLKEQAGFEKLLLLGLTPKQVALSVQAPAYKPFKFKDTEILYAAPPDMLNADKKRKLALWIGLQQLFNLK